MHTRYNLHGDKQEGDSNLYYCAKRDIFAEIEHFAEINHKNDNERRYLSGIESWPNVITNSRGKYTRPKNADNIFTVSAKVYAQKANAKGSFYKWLEKQVHRDDPIGDLAVDVLRDSKFPKTINALDKISSYLRGIGACSEALQAAEEAFVEYKSKWVGISLSLRFDVFKRDEYRCCICGKSKSDGATLEVDHKNPVSNGGENELGNLWTLCFECNRGKGRKCL